MLDYFPQVEVPMLGVDHDPVQAEHDRDLGNRGRLERDPESQRRLASRKLRLEQVAWSKHGGIDLSGRVRRSDGKEITESRFDRGPGSASLVGTRSLISEA